MENTLLVGLSKQVALERQLKDGAIAFPHRICAGGSAITHPWLG